jgi:hypothetical protein
MPIKAKSKGLKNVGDHLVIPVGKPFVEMNPWKNDESAFAGKVDKLLVVYKRHLKLYAVTPLDRGDLHLALINIPSGTPKKEKEALIESTKDMVRLRWGKL